VDSEYGAGHPLGIDINGEEPLDKRILAATEGTVVFAGGNSCCAYGLYIVILSPTGIETLYGHMNELWVEHNNYVQRGQALGLVGDTGYSTGPHLHFEVIDNGVRVNPLDYLP
jgi:murein DD-endopeptidase MepM/ murein hydrolase activator NlpD